MSVREALTDAITAWADDGAWRRKVDSDADRIERCLPAELRELHGAVVARARSVDARALILSGSTVRDQRTEISDLDYHLIGPRIEKRDLSRELDLHVLSVEKLESDVLAGDDFVQWSLRFGCVVFDDGVVRSAIRLMVDQRPWPDVGRKRAHAAKSLDIARRFVETGDHDGALEQVRTALSLAARARILSAGVFPMARAELPSQLQAIGCREAARGLSATIYGSPSLAQLAAAVGQGEALIAAIAERTNGEATKQSS